MIPHGVSRADPTSKLCENTVAERAGEPEWQEERLRTGLWTHEGFGNHTVHHETWSLLIVPRCHGQISVTVITLDVSNVEIDQAIKWTWLSRYRIFSRKMEKGKRIRTPSKTGNGSGQGAETEAPEFLMCSLKFSIRAHFKTFLIFINWSTPAFINFLKSLFPCRRCQASAFLFCPSLFLGEDPHSMEESQEQWTTSSMLSLFPHWRARATCPGQVSLHLSQKKASVQLNLHYKLLSQSHPWDRQRKCCGSGKASF